MPYELSRRLAAGPLLCDGAMGPLLYACGVSTDTYLMPSFGRFEVVAEVLDAIR
jgi:hypothetical protein